MKMLQFAVLSALATLSLIAQPRDGMNTELSLSGAYENRSVGSNSGDLGWLLINPRLGFYVFKGLELEPEMVFMISGASPMYVLNGNVSYNFISAGNSVPFLLIGYGRANTVPFFNVPLGGLGFGVNVLNLGGGMKVILNKDIAVRFEYRFQKFTGQEAIPGYSSDEQVDARIHTVQFGLSVLL